MDDLERDLANYETGWDGDGPPPYDHQDEGTPPDATAASMILRRMRSAAAELYRIDDTEAREIQRVTEWAKDRAAGPLRVMAEGERLLSGFARAQHEAHGVKTWNLPHGVIRLRPPKPSTVVDDEPALIAWLGANGHDGAIKRTEVVLRTEVAKLGEAHPMSSEEVDGGDPTLMYEHLVTSDGEAIPGVHLVRPADPTVTVTAAK